jgi:nanoRNase/pAp phosphatase (c-di-AMP/oligoRNAs hydrolase)
MVSYYDPPSISDFIQFRLRRGFRYTSLDLRRVLDALKVTNGGGHPGAIGFRVRKADVEDIQGYVKWVIDQIETLVE